VSGTPRRRWRLLNPLDRYVLVEFTRIFGVTAFGFPLLVFVTDLVENLQKYLDLKIPRKDLALSYLYWLPDTMFLVLPAAVLFATVFSVGSFTRYSEITAAKASGISFFRFIRPILFGATLAVGLGLVLGELAPPANTRRMDLLKEKGRSITENERLNFVYASDAGRVYRVGFLDVKAGRLQQLEIERRGAASSPGARRRAPQAVATLIAADEAKYKANRGWVLGKGVAHVIDSDSTNVTVAYDSLWDRRLVETPRELRASDKAPEEMTFRQLGTFIAALERSGADVGPLQVGRMLKIAIPVTCVIIVLFGAPLATSSQRGGAAYGIAVSLGTTIVFLLMTQLTRAIGGKGLVPPDIAAWLPTIAFGIVGLVLMLRVRS
jgi:lipopolysaccharide export system permease protein